MMKKILLLLAVIFAAIGTATAQTSLVATLSHDGNVSTYYSANAFKDAYEASVDGDVITLSSGVFTTPFKISKNVTVRGAGMLMDGESTAISGDINIETENADSIHALTMEGIHFIERVYLNNGNDQSFIKCKFTRIASGNIKPCKNVRIIHCMADQIVFQMGDFIIVGSYLENPHFSAHVNIANCTLKLDSSLLLNGSMSNSLIIGSDRYDRINSSGGALVKSCVYVGPSTVANGFFYQSSSVKGQDNVSFPESTTVFKKESTVYELTDEKAKSWLGNDGTQVGMHGGNLPFDAVPSNPQITKFTVSPKTTADGKLSVDIEVKAD